MLIINLILKWGQLRGGENIQPVLRTHDVQCGVLATFNIHNIYGIHGIRPMLQMRCRELCYLPSVPPNRGYFHRKAVSDDPGWS